MKSRVLTSLLYLCFASLSSYAQQGSYTVSPDEIDLGELRPTQLSGQTIFITNNGSDPLELSFTSSCPCVASDPESVTIPAGDSVPVIVTLDPDEYSGEVRRTLVITSPNPGVQSQVVTITARVIAGAGVVPCAACNPDPPQDIGGNSKTAAGGDLTVDIYLDVGCRKCIEFLEDRVPELQESYERQFVIRQHDVLDPDAMSELLERIENSEYSLNEFPVAFILGIPVQGLERIENSLLAVLGGPARATALRERSDRAAPGVDSYDSFSLGSVLVAGLIDGVNPCAFSTILFLISMLALVGRTRREILTVGAVYTMVVFLGYFAAGLGLLVSVRSLMIFPTVTTVIRWVLVVMLGLLAVLSIRDAVLAAQGRTREMTLQLSDGLKRRIHGVVRKRVRMGSLIIGTVSLAVLVTIFEFSCTGQVYLPVIMHLARTADRARGLGLLAVYNVAFIVPLLIVFAAGYFGVSMNRVSTFFGKHVPAVKISLAVVFVLLAVMTIFI